jgi:hypothetical protein
VTRAVLHVVLAGEAFAKHDMVARDAHFLTRAVQGWFGQSVLVFKEKGKKKGDIIQHKGNEAD